MRCISEGPLATDFRLLWAQSKQSKAADYMVLRRGE
jgi:hypothetical protein